MPPTAIKSSRLLTCKLWIGLRLDPLIPDEDKHFRSSLKLDFAKFDDVFSSQTPNTPLTSDSYNKMTHCWLIVWVIVIRSTAYVPVPPRKGISTLSVTLWFNKAQTVVLKDRFIPVYDGCLFCGSHDEICWTKQNLRTHVVWMIKTIYQ